MQKMKWNIAGHQKQCDQLSAEVEQKNLTHAYLFSGPDQVGKFSIIQKFAQLLQCKNQACGQCEDCLMVAKKNHPDITYLLDDGESLKIEQVRKLIQKVSLTHQGRYQLILIENLDRMPHEAQNAFLKTLEEPHAGTLFLMSTSRLNRILPTIQSRVRHYYFSTLSDAAMRTLILEKEKDPIKADEILRLSQGCPGLAIEMLEDNDRFIEERQLNHQITQFLKKNDLNKKFNYVEEIEKDKVKLRAFMNAFSRHLRLLMVHYDSSSLRSLKEIVDLFDILQKTSYFIERNVNKKLALENFLMATER